MGISHLNIYILLKIFSIQKKEIVKNLTPKI